MTCREATDFLGDYVAGALAPAVQATFDAHLHKCGNCREFLTQYRDTIAAGKEAYADADTPPIPDELIRAILAALKHEPQ